MDFWIQDKKRKGSLPLYQYFYRNSSSSLKFIYLPLLKLTNFLYNIEISSTVKIGEGLYIGHPYGITINPKAVLGKNIKKQNHCLSWKIMLKRE